MSKNRTLVTYFQAPCGSQKLRVWICIHMYISVSGLSWNFQLDKSPQNRTVRFNKTGHLATLDRRAFLCLCVSLLYCLIVCLSPGLHNVFHTSIACTMYHIYAESVVKHQLTEPNLRWFWNFETVHWPGCRQPGPWTVSKFQKHLRLG